MVKAHEEQQANEKRFTPEIEQAEYIPMKSVRERLKVIFMAHGTLSKNMGRKGLKRYISL